jgi:hypothetical protein
MEEHVLQAPMIFAGPDDKFHYIGRTDRHLLHCLDGYFSSLRMKRFHFTPEILGKGQTVPRPHFVT